MKNISIIFMIFLTLTNLFSCARHKSPHIPEDNKVNDSSYNKINISYLDSNYNVSEGKTNMLGMSFKGVENIIVFSELEYNNKYTISIIDKINGSVVLMKYGNEKIFPDTISFYQEGTIVKGLVKMNKNNYDSFDITFYMNESSELFSSIKLTNDIEKFIYNPNLDNKENYQIHIMFNSLLILNSINNYILNYNSNIQTRGGLGTIFSALGFMAMGYAKGIAIIIGLVTVASILVIAFVVSLAALIDYLVKKYDSEAKKSESIFEVRIRNSSVIIVTEKEKDIINDKDTFDINTTLDLILAIKSQVGKDTDWRIKISSKDINDDEMKKYFSIKDLIPRPAFSFVLVNDGYFATGDRHSEYSYHLIIEKLKELPNNIKHVSIDFYFYDDSIINGYSSTNFSIGVR